MLKLRIIDPQQPNDLKELDLNLDTMLNHECLIGRYPNCNIVLDSAEVSRMHGKISLKNGNYYYTDLASRAGSRLNAEQIQINQDYSLKMGDMVQIGRFFLMVIGLVSNNEPTMIDLNVNVTTNVIATTNGQAVQQEVAIATEPTPIAAIASPLPAIPGRDPQEYMPLATVDSSQIERWMKGDITVNCIQIIDETHDVKTFRFVTDPPMLFTYKPGQFITLDLEINGEQVLRSYSISSTPSRPHTLEITVKRVPCPPDNSSVPPGLVSNWLHDNVKVGSTLKVNGPTGKFTCFANPSPKLLLISAGSGITPMMSMSRWLYDTASDVDIVFFHCARSPRDIIYRQELDWLAAQHQKFNLAISITRREPGQSWLSFTGRLDAAMLKLIAPDYKERTVYVCGPNPFMESVNDILESIDFPMENYYEESFGPPRKKVKKAPAPAPAKVEAAVSSSGNMGLRQMLGKISTEAAPVQEVVARSVTPVAAISTPVAPPPASSSQTLLVFSKSGKEVACDGEESILDMADQEGVKIRSSCRSGVCGTCKKRKLEGEVKMEGYDPEALEESEIKEGYILTCVAYPVGRVVVDA